MNALFLELYIFYYRGDIMNIYDCGDNPFVTNLKRETFFNNNFRTTRWTGANLQLTLMCIPPNSEIGLEMHPHLDQFLYIECGGGLMMMGNQKDYLKYQYNVSSQSAIIIPAGTWHNLKNNGCCDLKLFSIYAPPQHPFGTVHHTKFDSDNSGY